MKNNVMYLFKDLVESYVISIQGKSTRKRLLHHYLFGDVRAKDGSFGIFYIIFSECYFQIKKKLQLFLFKFYYIQKYENKKNKEE